MKTIFITIHEFLLNNGELEVGRKLYSKNKLNQFVMFGTYKEYNENINCLIAENRNASFPFSMLTSYVEIEVTPIYK